MRRLVGVPGSAKMRHRVTSRHLAERRPSVEEQGGGAAPGYTCMHARRHLLTGTGAPCIGSDTSLWDPPRPVSTPRLTRLHVHIMLAWAHTHIYEGYAQALACACAYIYMKNMRKRLHMHMHVHIYIYIYIILRLRSYQVLRFTASRFAEGVHDLDPALVETGDPGDEEESREAGDDACSGACGHAAAIG